MTEEVRFALQLGLNLAAVLLAGWLAGRYAARRIQKVLEVERQGAEEARHDHVAHEAQDARQQRVEAHGGGGAEEPGFHVRRLP